MSDLTPETLAAWRMHAEVIEREGAISGVRVLAARTVALMDSLAAMTSAYAVAASDRAALLAMHRDLTSRLGFGDGITEPQADNDTIVAWHEQQQRDADEWRESQHWRDDCHLAGHPDDEDCAEHDPALRLAAAEARVSAGIDVTAEHRDVLTGRGKLPWREDECVCLGCQTYRALTKKGNS